MPEYITPEGMARLHRRMKRLLEVERPAVIKQVVTAREMGDLSENAEYHAARERQRHIDHELNHLRNRLGKLQALDSANIPKDAVRFGARVLAREEPTGEETLFRLVGVDETDDSADDLRLVSVASPIGQAMIGKKPGQKFEVKAPAGDRVFEVISIS
ncbi:MAG: transcription elongation factor GreA [Candidatus Cloacimonetes bacterium]|nr:transcription elongation factor GreA [Candidatus Cloacimonadota bacterium]